MFLGMVVHDYYLGTQEAERQEDCDFKGQAGLHSKTLSKIQKVRCLTLIGQESASFTCFCPFLSCYMTSHTKKICPGVSSVAILQS
jgi:hypothetical protein